MSDLKLFLFGHPRIEYDGEPIDIARRKGMALLAFLAMSRQRHGRDMLAAMFWPDYDQTTARAALRRTLSTLVVAIGKNWLEIDHETIGLNWNANVLIDVAEFRRLLLEAWRPHGHADSEICDSCEPLLIQAISLYKDDFLAGFSLRNSADFDDWQSVQVQILRRERVDALKRLATGLGSQKKLKTAIEYAQLWLALDPLEEKAHRLLMLLYARGDQRAAALAQYQQCVRFLEQELKIEPAEETKRLYQAIYAGGPIDPGQTRDLPPEIDHLPHPNPRFIGRDREKAEIAKLLINPTRMLITLTGPGGIGKTWLAIRVAADVAEYFADGAFFVPLTHLSGAQSVGYAVAEALGLDFANRNNPTRSMADELEQVRSYLRNRQVLLVIDNFEHVIEGARAVDEILQVAPRVKILATSRERLNLSGETVFTVGGMEFPKWDLGHGQNRPPKDPRDFDAVKLFVQQAQTVMPHFSPGDEEVALITRICRQLEGMPLAIELAAGWTRALPLREIARHIDESLDFLNAPQRDLNERHRSLRAVFDHSWKLLSEQEQNVYSNMSVFHGGFPQKAALRVAGATLSLLLALVDKSLLQWNPTSGRYEVHELLRQYAQEKLSESSREMIGKRHYDYYVESVRQWAEQPGIRGNERLVKEIDDEMENLVSMFEWAVLHRTVDEIRESLEHVLQVRTTTRSDSKRAEVSKIVCKVCGYHNRAGVSSCIRCGVLLLGDVSQGTRAVTGPGHEGVLSGQRDLSQRGTASFTEKNMLVISLDGSSEIYHTHAAQFMKLVVGRYDPFSGSIPDIDLNPFGGFEKGVSRRHALIERRDGCVYIIDQGSINGTYVNRHKLPPHQPHKMRSGDDVFFGKLLLHFWFRETVG